jgi:hypothetical protein
MEQTAGWKRRVWYWAGVVMLSMSALWWLQIVLVIVEEPEDIASKVGVGLFLSALPIAIGFYCVRLGRKAPVVERPWIPETVPRPLRETPQDYDRRLGGKVMRKMTLPEYLCTKLCDSGIDTQIAEPSLVKHIDRVIGVSIVGSPVSATVHIPQGPIRWFNVMEQSKWLAPATGSMGIFLTRYGVPDQRLKPSSHKVQIKANSKKALLGLGRTVDLKWKGKDGGLGIIDRLNSDISLKGLMMWSGGDEEIRANRHHGCWIIRRCATSYEDCLPSKELWDCYQAIAQHLLAEWSSR